MSLAIFDLDNTLIAGDSDHLWGEFLVEQGVVDGTVYREANDHFYELYKTGRLDIREFLEFSLAPLAAHPLATLLQWRRQFVERKIKPIMLPAARQLVERHRAANDDVLVITATNEFVTAPIVELYGIENLLATTPELADGSYTGAYVGVPCFREGKVTRLEQWLAKNGKDLIGSWFYSDSHNDIPLLSQVANPVAVDPDETLRTWAHTRKIPVISLRE